MRIIVAVPLMLGMIFISAAAESQETYGNDQTAKTVHDEGQSDMNAIGSTEDDMIKNPPSAPTIDTGQVIQKSQDVVNSTGALIDSIR